LFFSVHVKWKGRNYFFLKLKKQTDTTITPNETNQHNNHALYSFRSTIYGAAVKPSFGYENFFIHFEFYLRKTKKNIIREQRKMLQKRFSCFFLFIFFPLIRWRKILFCNQFFFSGCGKKKGMKWNLYVINCLHLFIYYLFHLVTKNSHNHWKRKRVTFKKQFKKS
jgi:hypothetical protein